jgi:hypothetical protein
MSTVPAQPRVWALAVMEATKAKKEVEKKMVRISVEVRSGSATFRVGVQAQSIERALQIVQRQNPTKECKMGFPIDPEAFFVMEEQRVGRVGALAMAEAA